MTSPRFDPDVKYRIPGGLYTDIVNILHNLGIPLAPLCSHCEKEGVWIYGDHARDLLDLLHEIDDQEAIIAGSELYAVIAEPEPEGNDGQDILQ